VPSADRQIGLFDRGRPVGPVHGNISAVTAPTAAVPELTHPCVRCGAPVPIDVGLCERCNPLGLRDSSASQVHGIAIAGVAAAVIVLAILARFAVSGVGPFNATVVSAAPDSGGLAITLQVTNTGTSTGQTTCRVQDPADRNGARGGLILSPQVQPGQTLTFTKHLDELGPTVRPFSVECSTP
jgi:hypothetical protein